MVQPVKSSRALAAFHIKITSLSQQPHEKGRSKCKASQVNETLSHQSQKACARFQHCAISVIDKSHRPIRKRGSQGKVERYMAELK